jgi:hypothetical protein
MARSAVADSEGITVTALTLGAAIGRKLAWPGTTRPLMTVELPP